MGRAPCCDKANVKRGPWSPEEDAKLKAYIEQHGTGGNWIALPQKIGLKRCGKSCRLRWLNYLRPNIKHGGFSEEEDNIICSLYLSIGSRWSVIAAQLPGRTDNDIKNYWNTRLKKKLITKQRKEILQEAQKANCLKQLDHDQIFKEAQSEKYLNLFTLHAPCGDSHLNHTISLPQLPFTMPPQDASQGQNPNFFYYYHQNQDKGTTRNPIKMEGGGYSEATSQLPSAETAPNHQFPFSFPFSQDPELYGTLTAGAMNAMSSSTNSPLPSVITSDREMLQGFESFPFELINDMIRSDANPCLDGFAENSSYYAMEMAYNGSVTAGTSTSADQSTITWDDNISSLVYNPPYQSNLSEQYEGSYDQNSALQQLHPSAFEDSSCFGSQQ